MPILRIRWDSLPVVQAMKSLPIKTIASSDQVGDIHTVERIGIDFKLCCPFAIIDRQLYRLPESLREWILSSIELGIEFPCKVEFSMLQGRACADFVIDN